MVHVFFSLSWSSCDGEQQLGEAGRHGFIKPGRLWDDFLGGFRKETDKPEIQELVAEVALSRI